MTKHINGIRIGRSANISVGCSASIFNSDRTKILLVLRLDNGEWCLPGGHVEPGESVSETCIREIKEETGFTIKIKRLIGVYSDPNTIVMYPDGNTFQIIALNFEAVLLDGKLREFAANTEIANIGFFSQKETKSMSIMKLHEVRIKDSFMKVDMSYIR
ncbi:MAG: NUDIX domain-containing protein [Bacteroidota bacterium]